RNRAHPGFGGDRCAGEVVDKIECGHSARGERSWRFWNQHSWDLKAPRQPAGDEWAAAAKCDQNEVPRIVSLLDRDRLKCGCHLGFSKVDDSAGCVLDVVHTEWTYDLIFERGACGLDVQPYLAAQEIVRID